MTAPDQQLLLLAAVLLLLCGCQEPERPVQWVPDIPCGVVGCPDGGYCWRDACYVRCEDDEECMEYSETAWCGELAGDLSGTGVCFAGEE